MPYITKERANEISDQLSDSYRPFEMLQQEINTKGELNYAVSTLMVKYLNKHGKNYQNISDVIAAAQDAADEMKRRVLAPYEEAKKNDSNNVDPYEGL